MARSLTYEPRLPTAAERLEDGVAQHADALLEALELLEVLHGHRLTEGLTNVVRGGSALTGHALSALNEPGAVRTIRSVLELLRTFGGVDPVAFQTVLGALSDGVQEGARRVREKERVSTLELLGLLRDDDVNLALSALVGTLRGLGRGLRERQEYGTAPVVEHL
ncbi:DUF1641 domain-containing protein (plasmid) [Deinococcus radiomollis]|uniref:DUF1641 domain-containing protein n=1 Tax=Deinococcus radiomollis TaxID=468916 RepID=UPI003891ADE2